MHQPQTNQNPMTLYKLLPVLVIYTNKEQTKHHFNNKQNSFLYKVEYLQVTIG